MHICVLDFEATCHEKGKQNHEIIEFPSILYLLKDKKLTYITEFREYCKPTGNPLLSEFCTNLTGITQDKIDSADSFHNIFKRHQEWLKKHVENLDDLVFLSCGAWDWGQLEKECRCHKITIPKIYTRYINIKKEFQKAYKNKNPLGMAGMLTFSNMTLIGKHHCGLDDCKNIGRILEKLVNEGFVDFETVIMNYKK